MTNWRRIYSILNNTLPRRSLRPFASLLTRVQPATKPQRAPKPERLPAIIAVSTATSRATARAKRSPRPATSVELRGMSLGTALTALSQSVPPPLSARLEGLARSAIRAARSGTRRVRVPKLAPPAPPPPPPVPADLRLQAPQARSAIRVAVWDT
ncbi:hypothetical protein FB451DRAFT_93141 [Mycena latifolia]|nr:hypothetical protein FB451DRAFT_93141 [Mycena latifolia]